MHTTPEEESRFHLQTLREAAEAGIADIEAGHFRDFGTTESLHRLLSVLAKTCLSGETPDGNNT